MHLVNPYLHLGSNAYHMGEPTPVSSPSLVLWNESLANTLGIPQDWQQSPNTLSAYFSGNQKLPHSTPISLAYAGHQFGHFNPQLGDGRAHYLGSVKLADQSTLDIQLKGAGRTHYSRQGDGRCAMGPAIREYIMSEALFELGVSTARTLAVVGTGERVYRKILHPGAIVTRVARSHLRVGTFQYFAARQDHTTLWKLVHLAVEQLALDASTTNEADLVITLLKNVIEKQITTVLNWMRVGFIHGVMNTDNCLVSGETIDFGPCAMLGHYKPSQYFSSIDQNGRYAFGNQPNIILWNLARFAESLISLIDSDADRALSQVEPLFEHYGHVFEADYYKMLAHKIGLDAFTLSDKDLINDLLKLMHTHQLDYTDTFASLTQLRTLPSALVSTHDDLAQWQLLWLARISNQSDALTQRLMQTANPVIIPRNEYVENAVKASENGDMGPALALLEALKNPYQNTTEKQAFTHYDKHFDASYLTFCGT